MSEIYALIDPRDNLAHYIGQSNKASRRMIEHRNEHGRVNPQKTAWLQDLAEHELEPELIILETVDDPAQVDARELHWIKHGRAQGWPLVNKAHGYETAERKLNEIIERAIKLGILPRQVTELEPHQKRALLGVLTEQAERRLATTYEALEAARKVAEGIEKLLEQITEVAHEFDNP